MARILVVDDDPLFLAIMTRALEKAQHTGIAAPDCTQAIEHLDKDSFDALVCDLVLPNPTGLQVIRHARHGQPEMPIVAISGGKANGKSVHVDVFHMAQTVGATTLIKKPFELREFVATVAASLEPARKSGVAG